MRRLIAAILITATAGFVLATVQPASAADPASEAAFVNDINAFRGSQGVGGLTPHSVLADNTKAYWTDHRATYDPCVRAPMDELEALREVCVDLGTAINEAYWDTPKDERTVRRFVLIGLHARGLLATSEIIALLRSGHPLGARARWRTLHELKVVATLLAAGESARTVQARASASRPVPSRELNPPRCRLPQTLRSTRRAPPGHCGERSPILRRRPRRPNRPGRRSVLGRTAPTRG